MRRTKIVPRLLLAGLAVALLAALGGPVAASGWGGAAAGRGLWAASAGSQDEAEDGALEEVDRGLREAWEELSANLPDEEPAVLAVAPFTDPADDVRVLGWYAKSKVEEFVSARPEITLVDRENLKVLIEERDIWQADFASEAGGELKRRLRIARADYYLTGKLVPAGGRVILTVRLILVASGRSWSKTFDVEADREVCDCLAYCNWSEDSAPREEPIEVPPIRLACQLRAQSRRRSGGAAFTLEDGGVLYSGDQFQISFEPYASCWVYIFLVNSRGRCSTLFPYPGVDMSNRCEGGISYTVPNPDAGGSRWFVLDENAGTETIFVVASYEPISHIESVVEDMQRRGADPAAAGKLRRAVGRFAAEQDRDHSSGLRVRRSSLPGARDFGPAGEVLRGRFAAVKVFTIEHRDR